MTHNNSALTDIFILWGGDLMITVILDDLGLKEVVGVLFSWRPHSSWPIFYVMLFDWLVQAGSDLLWSIAKLLTF